MRNNTNYMETGVLSALELTASFSKTVLENFYIKSRNSIDSGSKDAPYGYVFPSSQKDMTRVAFVVNVMRNRESKSARPPANSKSARSLIPPGRWSSSAISPTDAWRKSCSKNRISPPMRTPRTTTPAGPWA